MGNGSRKFDVAHSLSPHFSLGNLYSATVADDSLVSDSLVLTAVALPVFHRPENLLAEKTVLFGLQSSVVDGFRLSNLAV